MKEAIAALPDLSLRAELQKEIGLREAALAVEKAVKPPKKVKIVKVQKTKTGIITTCEYAVVKDPPVSNGVMTAGTRQRRKRS